MFQQGFRKRLLGPSFIIYMGAFYCGINLYLNDKLRAEKEMIEKMGRRKESLIEIHQRIADSYEKKTENLEFRNSIHKYRRVLISYAKGNILELGVGTGRSLEFYNEDCSVIGVDYSSKMLEQAINKIEDRELNRIKTPISLELMDCEDLRFPENSFDSVVDIMNLHTYNDYTLVIQNVKRVLKNNGKYIVMTRGKSSYFFITDFFKVFKPYSFMKQGQDLTIDWEDVFEKDKDWQIEYKERKNYGRTYLYILKLNK